MIISSKKLINQISIFTLDLLRKGLPVLLLLLCFAGNGQASQLYVGAANVDITPPLPVALEGQMYLRVARVVETSVTANIIALENREDHSVVETTIFVSVDLVQLRRELRSKVLRKVKKAVPAIDTSKIIMNATHTHSGPLTKRGKYKLPDGVTSVKQTLAYMSDQIANGIQKAWAGRRPGSVTWGLGHAALAVNRRAIYYNGSAQMYGATDLPEFRGLEGPSPDNVDILFFWDEEGTLLATSVDVPCPAQTVEHREAVNADYWHPVREQLKRRFGNQLVVLGWIGAAGDQSPHPMYEGAAEKRMRQLQGIDRLNQLAGRVVEAVKNVYEVVKTDKHSDVELTHKVREIELPKRRISYDIFRKAKTVVENIESAGEQKKQHRRLGWNKSIIEKYKEQAGNSDRNYTTKILHVVRLGDIAICAPNQFELYTEFGVRIKARSKALQTFYIELAGPATYLPTMDAVKGGGFTTRVYTNEVTPEAGQMLVDHTVELINEMWPEE